MITEIRDPHLKIHAEAVAQGLDFSLADFRFSTLEAFVRAAIALASSLPESRKMMAQARSMGGAQ